MENSLTIIAISSIVITVIVITTMFIKRNALKKQIALFSQERQKVENLQSEKALILLEIERLNSSLTQLQRKNQSLQSDIESKQQYIESLGKEKQQLLSTINRNAVSINNLEQANSRLHEENNSKQARIHTLENEKSQLRDEINRTTAAIKSLEQNNNNLRTDIESKQELINALNHKALTYQEGISVFLKALTDQSDLLLFNRELIHTVAYYNPFHVVIRDFYLKINDLDENLKKKEIALKVGEYLSEMNFDNIDEKMNNYYGLIQSLLYEPCCNTGNQISGIHDAESGTLFCKKLINNIDTIMTKRQDEINKIDELYHILINNYEKWYSIIKRPRFLQILLDLWKTFKAVLINNEYGNDLGTVINSWINDNTLDDQEYVQLYHHTIQCFIESSVAFSKNLDADFTMLEMTYQEYRESESILLYKALLDSDGNPANIYDKWRSAQHSEQINNSVFLQQTFDELKNKALDIRKINNIRNLIGCSNTLLMA